MSINTLKKKSESKYFNKVSSGTVFSLTGTKRLQGYVGQTNLSRSTKMTPYTRFGGPRGHGAKYGIYPINIHNSGKLATCNDDNTIKKPTSNTKGLISSKYKWNKRGYPYTVVQSDSNSSLFDTSSRYTHDLAASNTCVGPTDITNVEKNCISGAGCSNYIGGRRVVRMMYSQQFASSVPQSMYILSKTKRCATTSMGNTSDSTEPAKINNSSLTHFTC
jgi:hypothetical protein|tara:strand:- start:1981 stop:2637 length:657 start_codon:yes stop_codon:yes gene_type:complete